MQQIKVVNVFVMKDFILTQQLKIVFFQNNANYVRLVIKPVRHVKIMVYQVYFLNIKIKFKLSFFFFNYYNLIRLFVLLQ